MFIISPSLINRGINTYENTEVEQLLGTVDSLYMCYVLCNVYRVLKIYFLFFGQGQDTKCHPSFSHYHQ